MSCDRDLPSMKEMIGAHIQCRYDFKNLYTVHRTLHTNYIFRPIVILNLHILLESVLKQKQACKLFGLQTQKGLESLSIISKTCQNISILILASRLYLITYLFPMEFFTNFRNWAITSQAHFGQVGNSKAFENILIQFDIDW